MWSEICAKFNKLKFSDEILEKFFENLKETVLKTYEIFENYKRNSRKFRKIVNSSETFFYKNLGKL